MKPFLFLICLVFFKLNGQYEIDSAKTLYIHHTKSYLCKLKLRMLFNHSLTYKGYIYSIDSTQIIVCKKPPHLINHENLKEVKFVKFFPENIDVIKLRRLHKQRKGIPFTFALSAIPAIAAAATDPPGMFHGFQTYFGILYSLVSFPIYLSFNSFIFSYYSKYKVEGLKENYYIKLQKIKQLPHF